MYEDWETSWLDRTNQSQVSYVYDRQVSFQVGSFSADGLSEGGVLVFNDDRTTSYSRQDSNSMGQDGKCDQQAIEIHDRTVAM